MWCYFGQWPSPSRLCPILGRWHRPLRVEKSRPAIAAVHRDQYPPGWGIATGAALDWNCDVHWSSSICRMTVGASPLKTQPLVMPPTEFSLADESSTVAQILREQVVTVSGKKLTCTGAIYTTTRTCLCCNRAMQPAHPRKLQHQARHRTARLHRHHRPRIQPRPPAMAMVGRTGAGQLRSGAVRHVAGRGVDERPHPLFPKKMVPRWAPTRWSSCDVTDTTTSSSAIRITEVLRFSRRRHLAQGHVWDRLEDEHAFMIPHQLADLGNRPTDWSHPR